MAFSSHVYSSKFWKPDNRCFFQMILHCFTHNCIMKVKKSRGTTTSKVLNRRLLFLRNLKNGIFYYGGLIWNCTLMTVQFFYCKGIIGSKKQYCNADVIFSPIFHLQKNIMNSLLTLLL